MKRWLLLISWIATSVAAGIGGFSYGLQQGWQLGLMADAAPRGVLAAGNLRAIRAGNTEPIMLLLESDVDLGLLWSHRLRKHPLAEYFEPVWGLNAFTSDDKYVERLAKYRKVNPSPFKADAFDNVPEGQESAKEFYAALAQQSREDKQIIEAMVSRYSSK